MAAQDLFAPPSKEELAGTQTDANMDLFAPPTKEEMSGPHSSWLDTKLPGGTARGYIKGALNTLPTVGMVSGGLLGTAAEPGLGTVAGAGLGGAAGKALQNIGEKYLLDEDKNREQIYLDPVKAGLEGATVEGAGQIAGKGMQVVSEIPAIQKGLSKIGKGASKVGQALTGVPEKEIQTYAKNADEVKALARSGDNDIQEMSDQVRQNINDALKNTRKGINSEISDIISNSSKDKNIDVSKVIQKLDAYKNSLNPELHAESIKEIDGLISKIKGAAPLDSKSLLGYQANTTMREAELPEHIGTYKYNSREPIHTLMQPNAFEPILTHGEFSPVVNDLEDRIISLPVGGRDAKHSTNLNGLNEIKNYLQDLAEPAYGNSPLGFQVGKTGSRAARDSAGVARSILEEASPDLGKLNGKLANLHRIEDVMNKNMLSDGKTPASLLSAGSGNNPTNAKVLRELGEATGEDILGKVEKLSSARTFGSPQLMAQGSNGKTLSHILSGTGIGGLLGYESGGKEGALIGAGIGAGLTSPMALRTAIDAGLLGKSAINEIASTPAGRELLMKAVLPTPKGTPVQEVSPGLLQQLTEKDSLKNRTSMKQDR